MDTRSRPRELLVARDHGGASPLQSADLVEPHEDVSIGIADRTHHRPMGRQRHVQRQGDDGVGVSGDVRILKKLRRAAIGLRAIEIVGVERGKRTVDLIARREHGGHRAAREVLRRGLPGGHDLQPRRMPRTIGSTGTASSSRITSTARPKPARQASNST